MPTPVVVVLVVADAAAVLAVPPLFSMPPLISVRPSISAPPSGHVAGFEVEEDSDSDDAKDCDETLWSWWLRTPLHSYMCLYLFSVTLDLCESPDLCRRPYEPPISVPPSGLAAGLDVEDDPDFNGAKDCEDAGWFWSWSWSWWW